VKRLDKSRDAWMSPGQAAATHRTEEARLAGLLADAGWEVVARTVGTDVAVTVAPRRWIAVYRGATTVDALRLALEEVGP